MPFPTPTLVSPEEYLASSYEPDVEYVDGVLVERTVPDGPHGRLQCLIERAFGELEAAHNVLTFVETRVLIAESPGLRYRVPDVCLVQQPVDYSGPLAKVPLVVVEIMSPNDLLQDFIEKCLDYEQRGVPHIWIANPKGSVMVWRDRRLELSSSLRMPIAELGVEIPFDRIFAEATRSGGTGEV